PSGWSQANSTSATFTASTAVGHSGTTSAEISGTSGTNSAEPAWTTIANVGTITTGQNLQATVWAKGAAATGSTQIAVAWYGSNSTYISGSLSTTLPPGVSNWTE